MTYRYSEILLFMGFFLHYLCSRVFGDVLLNCWSNLHISLYKHKGYRAVLSVLEFWEFSFPCIQNVCAIKDSETFACCIQARRVVPLSKLKLSCAFLNVKIHVSILWSKTIFTVWKNLHDAWSSLPFQENSVILHEKELVSQSILILLTLTVSDSQHLLTYW